MEEAGRLADLARDARPPAPTLPEDPVRNRAPSMPAAVREGAVAEERVGDWGRDDAPAVPVPASAGAGAGAAWAAARDGERDRVVRPAGGGAGPVPGAGVDADARPDSTAHG